jgi:hypothetical protein
MADVMNRRTNGEGWRSRPRLVRLAQENRLLFAAAAWALAP